MFAIFMRTRNIEKVSLVKQKAVELLVINGFEGFSINKLARICNTSVATLYIYYKDKDDLIIQIGKEEAQRMRTAVLKGFDPEDGFEKGLRKQWENRYDYLVENPMMGLFFEQLRTSSYQDKIYSGFRDDYDNIIGRFISNAVARGELSPMPLEVYWSVAFAPLHSLLRAHNEGKRSGGKPFIITGQILWKTFDMVIKALKP